MVKGDGGESGEGGDGGSGGAAIAVHFSAEKQRWSLEPAPGSWNHLVIESGESSIGSA